jgi:cytoskeletal protein RodZ
MTTPREEQPQAQPAPEPTVSTAPPGRRRHSIPSHVGPARTSTVILAVLWLALGMLYLNVRPPTPATATTAGTSVESPAPTRTAPSSTSSAPPSTTGASTTTAPSSAPLSAPSSAPETTTAPSETSPLPGTVPPPTTGLPPTS